jgi:hypothetical protein
MLRKLARARFPEDKEVVDQQLASAAAFVAAAQAEKEKALDVAHIVISMHPRIVVGSIQVEEEAWALAPSVAANQDKEVLEVAEDVAHQAVAFL